MQWKNKVTFTDEKRGRDRRRTIETSQPNKQGNTNDFLDDDHKKAWKPIQKYIRSIPLYTRISTVISGIEIYRNNKIQLN